MNSGLKSGDITLEFSCSTARHIGAQDIEVSNLGACLPNQFSFVAGPGVVLASGGIDDWISGIADLLKIWLKDKAKEIVEKKKKCPWGEFWDGRQCVCLNPLHIRDPITKECKCPTTLALADKISSYVEALVDVVAVRWYVWSEAKCKYVCNLGEYGTCQTKLVHYGAYHLSRVCRRRDLPGDLCFCECPKVTQCEGGFVPVGLDCVCSKTCDAANGYRLDTDRCECKRVCENKCQKDWELDSECRCFTRKCPEGKWMKNPYTGECSDVRTQLRIEALTGIVIFGDPHYMMLNGTMITCNQLGWQTLATTAKWSVAVMHSPASATGLGAVITAVQLDAGRASFLWSMNDTTISPLGNESSNCSSSAPCFQFISKVFNATLDASVVELNENGIRAPLGLDITLSVRRNPDGLSASLATALSVSAGILVDGCPHETPMANPPEFDACRHLLMPNLKDACNYDVLQTNNTRSANAANGSVDLLFDTSVSYSADFEAHSENVSGLLTLSGSGFDALLNNSSSRTGLESSLKRDLSQYLQVSARQVVIENLTLDHSAPRARSTTRLVVSYSVKVGPSSFHKTMLTDALKNQTELADSLNATKAAHTSVSNETLAVLASTARAVNPMVSAADNHRVAAIAAAAIIWGFLALFV